MLKEPHKLGPTTPRVVYLCPLDLGGLIGVGPLSERSTEPGPASYSAQVSAY